MAGYFLVRLQIWNNTNPCVLAHSLSFVPNFSISFCSQFLRQLCNFSKQVWTGWFLAVLVTSGCVGWSVVGSLWCKCHRE